MGLFTSIALGIAAIGATLYTTSQAGKQKTSAPSMPNLPSATDATAQATAASKRQRSAMARSKSIYTSPLGVSEEAGIARKQLLGQ